MLHTGKLEQPSLILGGFHGRGARFVVIRDMVYPTAHGIASHQPGIARLQEIGRRHHIFHAGVEPEIVGMWIKNDWHPVVDGKAPVTISVDAKIRLLFPVGSWYFLDSPGTGQKLGTLYRLPKAHDALAVDGYSLKQVGTSVLLFTNCKDTSIGKNTTSAGLSSCTEVICRRSPARVG